MAASTSVWAMTRSMLNGSIAMPSAVSHSALAAWALVARMALGLRGRVQGDPGPLQFQPVGLRQFGFLAAIWDLIDWASRSVTPPLASRLRSWAVSWRVCSVRALRLSSSAGDISLSAVTFWALAMLVIVFWRSPSIPAVLLGERLDALLGVGDFRLERGVGLGRAALLLPGVLAGGPGWPGESGRTGARSDWWSACRAVPSHAPGGW